MSRTDTLRFRQSGATLVAVLIAFMSALPLAGARWALTPILLIPLAVGVWAWRAGTDVDTDGLRVRALFGSTHIPWQRVAELAADPRGRASALLADGHTIRLTGVRAKDLPAVVAVASGRLTTDGDASIPVDDAVDQRLAGDEPA